MQAIIRYWIRKLRIESNENNNRVLEMALVMLFLPHRRMDEGLTLLGREILRSGNARMIDFHEYWRKTWLPLASAISVFDQEVKTNNISENCNRHLEQKVGRRQPLWHMLGNFKKF